MLFRYGLLLLPLFAFAQMGPSHDSDSLGAPGEVIIRYRKSFRRDHVAMNAFYEKAGVQRVSRIPSFEQVELLTFSKDRSVEELISEIRKNPEVEFAEPNTVYRLPVKSQSTRIDTDPEIKPAPPELFPPRLDPYLDNTYGLKITQANQVWTRYAGKNVIVADIDTGVDYNHEDLSFNMWRNPNPTHGDIVGYDFAYDDNLPFDDIGHGTHTSGIMAAVGGNGKGTLGIAPRASIMAVKIFDAHGLTTAWNIVRAFEYATANGAKIFSNSWGGSGYNQLVRDAIVRAGEKGVLVVFAAGNNSDDMDLNPDYPVSYKEPNMISVASTTAQDQLAALSNYGKTTVDLGAPGEDILSTVPGDRYEYESGTSMACPHVAATAALLWAKNPDWNYAQVKQAILESVDRVPALKDTTVSGGRLNVRRALGL